MEKKLNPIRSNCTRFDQNEPQNFLKRARRKTQLEVYFEGSVDLGVHNPCHLGMGISRAMS